MSPKFKNLGFSFLCLSLAVLGVIFYFRSSLKPLSINVANELRKLPKDDREALEWFFRDLHSEGPYSYVLFGDKPMSIYSFLEIEKQANHPKIYGYYDLLNFSINKVTRNNLMQMKGWETWKKYRAFFPSSNFTLLENHDHGDTTLVMINRRPFLKIVDDNIDEFRKVLGSQIIPQIILDRCICSQEFFRDALKYDDGLLGILLGYGRHNALLFSRRHQIMGVRDSQKFSLTKKTLLPSEGFATLEEEWDNIHKRLLAFDKSILDDFNPLLMALPAFAADPNHVETKELKSKYRKQYKNILKQFKEGDFLEITLNRFCNGS